MNRMIVPSVFALKDKEYRSRFLIASKLSNRIHVDVMDGHFVSAKSPPLNSLFGMNSGKEIDVHLMVNEPLNYLEDLKSLNVRRVYVHIEIGRFEEVLRILEAMRAAGFVADIAIKPETNSDELIPYSSHVDGCLVMSVHPGEEGQSFIYGTSRKLREIMRYMHGKEIAIDGGVNRGIALSMRNENVNILVVGSYIGNARNPSLAYNDLVEVFVK